MITQGEMATSLMRTARKRDPQLNRDGLVALVSPILKRHDQQSYTVHEGEILHRKLQDAMGARAPKALVATKAAPAATKTTCAATKASPAPRKPGGDSWALIAELKRINKAAADRRAAKPKAVTTSKPTAKAAAVGANTITIHRDARHPRRAQIIAVGKAATGRKS